MYDLAGVIKAMPIIWLEPEAYRYVIILVGTFHMIYLNMIVHKMEGSGYTDLNQDCPSHKCMGSGKKNFMVSWVEIYGKMKSNMSFSA